MFNLLFTRRFFPLFGTQFLGALNDNLLKTTLLVLMAYHGLTVGGLDADFMANLNNAIFVLPFFLFSATAGKLAEKIDKAILIRWIKALEVAIMVLASVGFMQNSAWILLLALWLMGVHSTFFGPIKYSILPQCLEEKELVTGNAWIESGTFLAILIGQIAAPILATLAPVWISVSVIFVALVGFFLCLSVPPALPTNPRLQLSWNVGRDTIQLVKCAWTNQEVRIAILGISWFWFVGAILTSQLPLFVRGHIGGNESVLVVVLALFSIGIGIGSLLCARWSHGQVQWGLVLLGGLGLSVFTLGLAALYRIPYVGELQSLSQYAFDAKAYAAACCLMMLSCSAGLLTVPLYTALQLGSTDSFRSQSVAANNVMNSLYMVIGAGLSSVFLMVSKNLSYLFACLAVANLLAVLHVLLVNQAHLKSALHWLLTAVSIKNRTTNEK